MKKLIVSLGIAMSLACAGGGAEAAIIPVTTEDDVVADDGRCSLREAVSAVNDASPSGSLPGECPAGDGSDTIRLGPGTYMTTLGASGDDANLGGDFDIARSVSIEGDGSSTRIRNGLGSRSVAGDGDRLFHVDPAGSGDVDVAFRGMALMDGEAFCNIAGCATGAGAIEATNARDLVVEDCTFSQNTAICAGAGCGYGEYASAAAIVHGAIGDLSIARTTFTRNTTECSGVDCRAGHVAFVQMDPATVGSATVELIDVEIRNNSATCASSRCIVGDAVWIEAGSAVLQNIEFRSNTSSCEGSSCSVGSFLDIDSTTTHVSAMAMVANRRFGKADSSRLSPSFELEGASLIGDGLLFKSDRSICRGDGCRVDELVDVDVELADIDGLTVVTSRGQCLGIDCVVDERIYLANFGGSHAIHNALVAKNTSWCRSDGCQANAILFLRGVELELGDSSVTSNKVFCAGDACSLTPIVAFYPIGDSVPSVVDSVDIVANRCSCRADECTVLAPACGLFVVTGGTAGARVSGATITKNRGDSVGAGIGSIASLLIEGCEISRNQSIRGGGGVYNGGQLAIEGTSIVRNRTRADRVAYRDFGTRSPVCGDGSGDCGGGILNQGTITSIVATTFATNRPDDCFEDGGTGCP